MTTDNDLLPAELALAVGFAHLLQTAGAGTWGGIDGPEYGPDVAWPIYLGKLPPDRRAMAVLIIGDGPLDDSSTRYTVQVQLRTAPGMAASAPVVQLVRDALHSRRQPPMPRGIRCTSIQLQTHNVLDRTGAWERHHLNFTALCARASAWAAGAGY
jgi:hypothetical protein